MALNFGTITNKPNKVFPKRIYRNYENSFGEIDLGVSHRRSQAQGCLLGGFILWLIGVLISLTCTIGLIYIVYHFVVKYW